MEGALLLAGSELVPALTAAAGLVAVASLSAAEPLFTGRPELRWIAGTSWVLSSAAFGARAYFTRDWHGDAFTAAAALYWLVVLATLGRPALVMDQLFTIGPPKERPLIPEHIRRRAFWGQVALIGGIFMIAVLWTT